MTRALPSATGLQVIGGLKTAKGIDVHFTPSLAIIAGRLRTLDSSIKSFREPLKQSLVQVIIPSIQKNFDVGGRPPWAPLADSTVATKGSSSILITTGALKRTMGQQNIWTITKNYMVLQDLPSNVWYGKVHQAGLGTTSKIVRVVGTNKKNEKAGQSVSSGEGIPARPFVLLQKSEVNKIESIFRHWLNRRIRMSLGR